MSADKNVKEVRFKIRIPEMKFDLANLFNAKAAVIGALSGIGVDTANQLVHAINNLNLIGMGGPGPMPDDLRLMSIGAGILTGVWNAHAIGGNTILFNSSPLNFLRNAAFMATSALGAATLAGNGTNLLTSSGNIALAAAGIAALGAAGWNAVSLKWTRHKPAAPAPVQPEPPKAA